MNTSSNAVPELRADSQAIATTASPETRPMYWSVRRELWENRSIYIAPLIVAAVVVFGSLISMIHLPQRRRLVLMLNPAQQRAAIETPYAIPAMMIILTAFIVGVFYCLEALHGERRDRSILFWKSLPVSDLTTVLSKASIPLVVLPVVIFAIIVATQLIMVLLGSAVLLMNGLPATTWTQLPLFQMWSRLLYALIAIALWHAPIYGWLLLVSAWARRAAFLWAFLPFLTINVFERMAFRSSYFESFQRYRLVGWFTQGFVPQAEGGVRIDLLASPDPARFLTTPGLWIGLGAAAILLTAAVELRRYREPI
jgi:ABC-2 type transport system permease protein